MSVGLAVIEQCTDRRGHNAYHHNRNCGNAFPEGYKVSLFASNIPKIWSSFLIPQGMLLWQQ